MGAMSSQVLKLPQSFPRAFGREVLTMGQAPVKQCMYFTLFHPHNKPRTCHLRLCLQIRTLTIKNVQPMCQPLFIYPFSNSRRHQKHNQGEAPVRTHLTSEGNLAGRSSAVNGKGGILFRFFKKLFIFCCFYAWLHWTLFAGRGLPLAAERGLHPLAVWASHLAEHRPPAHWLQERQPRAQELKLGGSAAWTQQPPL